MHVAAQPLAGVFRVPGPPLLYHMPHVAQLDRKVPVRLVYVKLRQRQVAYDGYAVGLLIAGLPQQLPRRGKMPDAQPRVVDQWKLRRLVRRIPQHTQALLQLYQLRGVRGVQLPLQLLHCVAVGGQVALLQQQLARYGQAVAALQRNGGGDVLRGAGHAVLRGVIAVQLLGAGAAHCSSSGSAAMMASAPRPACGSCASSVSPHLQTNSARAPVYRCIYTGHAPVTG